MRNKTIHMLPAAILLIAIIPLNLFAQGFDYSTIEIDVKPAHEKVPAGRYSELIITMDIPFGYSITDATGVLEIKSMKAVDGLEFGKLRKPDPDKVDEAGGHFTGTVEFRLPFTVNKSAESGKRVITLGFLMQACSEETGTCYFPTDPKDYTRTVHVEIVP